MSLILSGSDGVSDIDGSASTPAIRGTDANTGIFFPAADTIGFAEGGAEVARFDSSGRLLIGQTSGGYPLDVAGGNGLGIRFTETSNSVQSFMGGFNSAGLFGTLTNHPMMLWTNNAERARITSAGDLLVGATASGAKFHVRYDGNATVGQLCDDTYASSGTNKAIQFKRNSVEVGTITMTTTATAYNTSSDYRLKENIVPMTGALATIAQLKPCTYTWKADGSAGQGFIAHELQAVVSDCVTGEKDAVDADGNPQYQGVDTSFLVATLTAAIQELKAELDTVKAQNAAFEARLAALEAK